MATIWSVILNRIDDALGSPPWKEWRANIVTASTGPAEAGSIPMLSATGKLDASLIPASGGGGGNYLQVLVDFGFDTELEGDTARTTLIGQPWVNADSVILCNPFGGTTVDHDPDDTLVEGLVAYAENLVAGVGFDVVAYAPNNTWGQYLINVVGV